MEARSVPWSVDRYGRLLTGVSILSCAACLCIYPVYGICAAAGLGTYLLIGSITNRCMLHALLMRLGAQEREDLFLPGGVPRSAGAASDNNPSTKENNA